MGDALPTEADCESIAIIRDYSGNKWMFASAMLIGPLGPWLSQFDSHSLLRIPLFRVFLALTGVAIFLAGAWGLVSLARRKQTILRGTPDTLRLTVASRWVANPPVQVLTGDLRDLVMSVEPRVVAARGDAHSRAIENQRFVSVVVSGSAGEISFMASLRGIEDDYRERFDQWKRCLNRQSG